MDHIGELMTVGLPPSLAPSDFTAARFDDLPLPNIDVPLTSTAQSVIDRCLVLVNTSRDPRLNLTDHLTRAFWDTPECTVARLMTEDGILNDELVQSIEVMLGDGIATNRANPGTQPNLRLERVIIRAKREAYRRRHPEVSTMHLLWGLLRERSGPSIYEWERAVSAAD